MLRTFARSVLASILVLGSALAQGLPYIKYTLLNNFADQDFVLDGASATESFLGQSVIAVSPAGDLYLAPELTRVWSVFKLEAGRLVRVAGGGTSTSFTNGADAKKVRIYPASLAFDGQGNLYILSAYGGSQPRILRVDATGAIFLHRDLQGECSYPTAIAVDPNGNVFVSDTGNHRVIRVAPDGSITTVAGNGKNQGDPGDGGPATNAVLILPSQLAVAPNGVLYVSEGAISAPARHQIRRIDANGTITAYAGMRIGTRNHGDGPATQVDLDSVAGLALDSAGNLYVSERGSDYLDIDYMKHHRVRVISPAGALTTLAGSGQAGYSGDGGAATQARLCNPGSLATANGNVYVADYLAVRRISGGIINTVAGATTGPFLGDGGPHEKARLWGYPWGTAVDTAGNLYVGERGRIRKVAPDGTVSTFAGIGVPGIGGDGGPANAALVYEPSYLAFAPDGSLYFTDSSAHLLRRISPQGIITTVAGGANYVCVSGACSWQQQLYDPTGIAINANGNVFVAESGRHRVAQVNGQNNTTVIAGTGQCGFSGDGGSAGAAKLCDPRGLAVDAQGDLYVADSYNNRVRKISGGVITTAVGNGNDTSAGDGGPAAAASLRTPTGLACDAQGNLYIAEANGQRLRKVDSSSTIRTIAGGGDTSGEYYTATAVWLDDPSRVTVAGERLYLTESYGTGVTVVEPANIVRNGVVNAASFRAPRFSDYAVSPGELITIFGVDIGPPSLAGYELDGNVVKTSAGGTRVLFDDVPSPIIYSSSTQVAAAVPFSVAGKNVANLQIEYNGKKSNVVPMPIARAAPSLFALNMMGYGQGAVLNQDYSVNGPSNPAARGSIIMLYGTGMGQTSPPGTDGLLALDSFPIASLTAKATIGGKACPVVWTGVAPYNMAGVFQMNVEIAADVPTGDAVPVEIDIGGMRSDLMGEPNPATRLPVTIAVR